MRLRRVFPEICDVLREMIEAMSEAMLAKLGLLVSGTNLAQPTMAFLRTLSNSSQSTYKATLPPGPFVGLFVVLSQ